jgi:hypothetical protein
VDRYLTPLTVPGKSYPGKQEGVTLNFHRPLHAYINGLAECGLLVDRMKEIPTYKVYTSGPDARAKNRANQEMPLYLALRASKIGTAV